MRSDKFRGEVYFHVIESSRKLQHGDGRLVVPGKELKARVRHDFNGKAYKKPMECLHGMHGCKDILSYNMFTLFYGRWLCIVRLREKVRHFVGKSAGLRREVVAMRQHKEDSYCKSFWSNEEAYNWVMEKPWRGEK